MSWPLVGVVVPVYNDWDGLQRCLIALAHQSYPAALIRVRVVDNGSTDWPVRPVFPLVVEVIRHNVPGSYGARNRAALDWSVDVLAFTDADCCPEPQWLVCGVKALCDPMSRHPQAMSVVAGRIVLDANNDDALKPAEQLDQLLGFDQERTVRRAGFAVTANLFVTQCSFEALGGFRSDTLSGGDRDFCQRARAHGLTLHYCAGAVVRHPCRDWSGLLTKQRRILGGRLALVGAHPLARLTVLVLSVRPLFSESLRVLRNTHLPIPRKVKIICLVFRLRWEVFLEWFRLQQPGQRALR